MKSFKQKTNSAFGYYSPSYRDLNTIRNHAQSVTTELTNQWENDNNVFNWAGVRLCVHCGRMQEGLIEKGNVSGVGMELTQ